MSTGLQPWVAELRKDPTLSASVIAGEGMAALAVNEFLARDERCKFSHIMTYFHTFMRLPRPQKGVKIVYFPRTEMTAGRMVDDELAYPAY